MRLLVAGAILLFLVGCRSIPAHSGLNQYQYQPQTRNYVTDPIQMPSLPSGQPSFGPSSSQPQTYYINTPSGLVQKTCQTTRQGQAYCY